MQAQQKNLTLNDVLDQMKDFDDEARPEEINNEHWGIEAEVEFLRNDGWRFWMANEYMIFLSRDGQDWVGVEIESFDEQVPKA